MIVHKKFQKNYDKGSIEVQVNFNVENESVEVSNIHIHGTFDHGLSSSPTMEMQNNKTFLVAHYIRENGKNIIERIIENNYADDIVKQIQELKNNISKDGE